MVTLLSVPLDQLAAASFGLVLAFTQIVIVSACVSLCALARLLPRRFGAWWPLLVVLVFTLLTTVVTLFVQQFAAGLLADYRPYSLLLRNFLLAAILSTFLASYLVLQQRWRDQVAAEARARLEALQARIRPHFLFNALNAIVDLIGDKPAEAEEALLDLSDLLKVGVGGELRHTLGEEVALVQAYLRIEKLRLADRLEIDWQMPENLPDELEIPALILQPLVENAVIHGISARPDGGRLVIRAHRMSFKRLRFEIENPLPARAEREHTAGHGIGMTKIKQRLALAYEERASLKTWEHDGTFHAALTVPLDA